MRLTDVVTAQDIADWLRANYSKGISPEKLANNIYHEHTSEIARLGVTLTAIGFFTLAETMTLLQFLDMAIQHKTREQKENEHEARPR